MAHIVTMHVLVDEVDPSRVADGINEMLRTAQSPVEEGDPSWIVDWCLGSVDPVIDELNDSITNETYSEGDAFRDWVIFSREEMLFGGAGFWSNEYGWTTLDLATKFDPISLNMPHSRGMDAIFMLAPYQKNFYRFRVLEVLDETGAVDESSTTMFDCWAENSAIAETLAQKSYPGCNILEVTDENAT